MLIYDPGAFSSLRGFADAALIEYRRNEILLTEAAPRFRALLETILSESGLPYQSLRCRVKTEASFYSKAARPDPSSPMRPKYECPSQQIEDQLGLRIVTYLRRDVLDISNLIMNEFAVIATEDKAAHLLLTKRFGYQSMHHILKLRADRASMLENRRFCNVRCELQVRTILQDAWAEIEHNIGYKPQYDKLATDLERRFLTVAGVLELVDCEFERIKDDALGRMTSIHTSIDSDATEVDISPSALEYLISQQFGHGDLDSDVVASTAAIVKALGYSSAAELTDAIAKYRVSQQFKTLAIDYSDPVMRLYIVLALDKGATSLRSIVCDPTTQTSSWDSFFASLAASESESAST